MLDDLSTGFRQAVLHGELVVGNTGDPQCLEKLFSRFEIDTVMHFAAHTVVPESVANPLKYYGNNTCASRTLLEHSLRAGVKNVVFSSTAAVYGIPQRRRSGRGHADRADQRVRHVEAHDRVDAARRGRREPAALRSVTLFQRRGLGPRGRIGQATPKATLLTKVACEVAVGKRPYVSIFGTDYPTPDGTGVRDYIHVEDLADAHLKALAYLRRGGESTTLNCGYGRGYSVRELLAMVENVAGHPIAKKEEPRRAGDPPTLVARAARIRATLGWQPRHDDLAEIVTTSLEWERKLAAGHWRS